MREEEEVWAIYQLVDCQDQLLALFHFVVLPTPMEVSLWSFYCILLSFMLNLGMIMWICLVVVIAIVSVVTKLKVE